MPGVRSVVVPVPGQTDGKTLMSELEKIVAVQEKAQAIGEFLDYDTKYVLARWVDCTRELHSEEEAFDGWSYVSCPLQEHLVPVSKSIRQVLADYFEIDLAKAEEEEMQLRHELRKGGE